MCNNAIVKVKYTINKRISLKLSYILAITLLLFAQGNKTYATVLTQNFCEEIKNMPVVQIKSSNFCDNFGNCQNPTTYGNGILINPEDGIVLTAYHVLTDSKSALLEYIITRPFGSSNNYKSELLAVVPEKDLALLQITQDLNGNLVTTKQFSDLSTLPFILGSPEINQDDTVFIIGSIYGLPSKCRERAVVLSNLDDGNICVTGMLEKGYSGSPVFSKIKDKLELIGVIHRNKIEKDCAEVSTFPTSGRIAWRNVDNSTKQAWAENIELQGVLSNNTLALTISMKLYLANLVGQPVKVALYPFEVTTRRPITTTNNALKVVNTEQLVLNFDDLDQPLYPLDELLIQHSLSINLTDLTSQISLEQIYFTVFLFKVGIPGAQGMSLGNINLDLTTATPILLPAFTDTPTPILIPTETPTPTPPPIKPVLTGRIAYSRFHPGANHFDVDIYCLATNNICQTLHGLRQADFSAGGYLALNGQGNEHNSIIRMDLNYTNPRPITLHPEDARPHWSPDGNSIIFESTAEGPDHRSRIYRLEDSTQQPSAELRALHYINRPLVGHHPIYLSNRRVAYQGCDTWLNGSNCGIYTVREFGEEEPLRFTRRTDDIPTDNFHERVLFMSKQEGDWEIYLANGLDSIQRLTNISGCDGLATTSPDGSSIAFMTNRNGVWGIYVMNSDGSNQHPIVEVIEPQPQYNCDEIWLEERMSWGP